MLSKKLLTLVCVLGILAFGGCIFIPSGPAPPPAPPRVSFNGIQMMEIAATNASESHHLDPADLAAAVVKEINDHTKYTTMKAEVQKGGAAGDAVLKITVLSETAVPVPPSPHSSSSAKAGRWTFRFTVSSTLTKAGGEVVWSETDGTYPVFQPTKEDPQDAWNDPKVRRSFISNVGSDLVIRMFYGK
jgi:hypothetical protein